MLKNLCHLLWYRKTVSLWLLTFRLEAMLSTSGLWNISSNNQNGWNYEIETRSWRQMLKEHLIREPPHLMWGRTCFIKLLRLGCWVVITSNTYLGHHLNWNKKKKKTSPKRRLRWLSKSEILLGDCHCLHFSVCIYWIWTVT